MEHYCMLGFVIQIQLIAVRLSFDGPLQFIDRVLLKSSSVVDLFWCIWLLIASNQPRFLDCSVK
jgi:hypothetical protein